MHCRSLGTKENLKYILYIEQHTWVLNHAPYLVAVFQQGIDWNWLGATQRTLAQRKSGSTLQYNETLAWSRKGSRMFDYKWHLKCKENKTENVTYRNAALVYSLLGTISRSFSSTFLTKSKVDKTDAAVSVRVEWAICFPGQILQERWWQ